MTQESDEDRIRQKAHELWEAEGHPHGRDIEHWEQAREIIAIKDSLSSTLLPRETGAGEPVESSELRTSHGDIPNLSDQGEHDLTAVSRETVGVPPAPISSVASDEIASFAASSPPAPRRDADPKPSNSKAAVKPAGSNKTGKSAPTKAR